AGDGQVNQAAPGTFATGYECERKMWANLLFCPTSGLGTLLVMRRQHLFDWTVYRIQTTGDAPSTGLGYDSAPGGVWEEPVFKRVYDRIPWPAKKQIAVENSSFIPTASALGIKVT